MIVRTVTIKGNTSYVFGGFHLFLLFLKELIVILVFLELLLAAVEQQFTEVDKNSWLVWGGDFQLKEGRIE